MPRQEQIPEPFVTFDQNGGQKCKATTNFYWQQLSEKNGSFEELSVLIVQLNELGRVSLQ